MKRTAQKDSTKSTNVNKEIERRSIGSRSLQLEHRSCQFGFYLVGGGVAGASTLEWNDVTFLEGLSVGGIDHVLSDDLLYTVHGDHVAADKEHRVLLRKCKFVTYDVFK
jgi:hypothetical protein